MPAGKLVIYTQLPDTDPQKAVCKEYAEKYKAKFKAPESSFGGYAYDAIRMLNQALAKAGSDQAKIRGRTGRHQELRGRQRRLQHEPRRPQRPHPGRLRDGEDSKRRVSPDRLVDSGQ